MTTQEYLCRHFARMGARVVVRSTSPQAADEDCN